MQDVLYSQKTVNLTPRMQQAPPSTPSPLTPLPNDARRVFPAPIVFCLQRDNPQELKTT